MAKRLGIVAVFLLVILCLLLGIFWYRFLNTPIIPEKAKPLHYQFHRGESVRSLATDLVRMGYLHERLPLIILAHLNGSSRELQAGTYTFAPGTRPEALLAKLRAGDVDKHTFTIVEGWRWQDLSVALSQDPYLQDNLNGKSHLAIVKLLGLQHDDLEGIFLPDTYQFPQGKSALSILLRAHKAYQAYLQKLWQERPFEYPLKKPYGVTILASLIEKETAKADERTRVAGVLIRRLRKNMPLQVDASVIYGLGENYNGKLTRADMRKKTRYNTYYYRGLPPGPIAYPGRASLWAAVHPSSGTALYYVAKGDGSHVFSDTLKDHDAAIKKYLLGKK